SIYVILFFLYCFFCVFVLSFYFFFFFFQAEDGIRDFHVTGVQTCALPISRRSIGHPRLLRLDGCSRLRMMTRTDGTQVREEFPCHGGDPGDSPTEREVQLRLQPL